MSPEQASGEHRLDGRSDIYALGCVLFEMLAGDAPFTASTPQAVIAKKLAEPTPRIRVIREAVPAAVELALMKALEKTEVVAAEGTKRSAWRWIAAVAGAVAIAVAGALVFRGVWTGADSASGGYGTRVQPSSRSGVGDLAGLRAVSGFDEAGAAGTLTIDD